MDRTAAAQRRQELEARGVVLRIEAQRLAQRGERGGTVAGAVRRDAERTVRVGGLRVAGDGLAREGERGLLLADAYRRMRRAHQRNDVARVERERRVHRVARLPVPAETEQHLGREAVRFARARLEPDRLACGLERRLELAGLEQDVGADVLRRRAPRLDRDGRDERLHRFVVPAQHRQRERAQPVRVGVARRLPERPLRLAQRVGEAAHAEEVPAGQPVGGRPLRSVAGAHAFFAGGSPIRPRRAR
jgi:hypothetical protein